MYCQECGEQVRDGANSCPNCGTVIQQAPQGTGQQTQTTPQGTSQQTQTTQMGQQSQTAPQNTYGTQNTSGIDVASNVPIVGGIIYGAVAFAISFVITLILVFTELEGETNSLGYYAGDQVLAVLGWFFYNAHTVAITATTTDSSINILETAYQSAGSATTVPKLAYYVLPVVVLFLLSYTLANRATSSDVKPVEGAIAGASIALGYGAVSFLGGSSVFTVTEAGESAGPETGSIIIMMVLLYPVVIGGAAGYLARS